jgi:flagellar biosynthesis/type III secretory pathway protein FliH
MNWDRFWRDLDIKWEINKLHDLLTKVAKEAYEQGKLDGWDEGFDAGQEKLLNEEDQE